MRPSSSSPSTDHAFPSWSDPVAEAPDEAAIPAPRHRAAGGRGFGHDPLGPDDADPSGSPAAPRGARGRHRAPDRDAAPEPEPWWTPGTVRPPAPSSFASVPVPRTAGPGEHAPPSRPLPPARPPAPPSASERDLVPVTSVPPQVRDAPVRPGAPDRRPPDPPPLRPARPQGRPRPTEPATDPFRRADLPVPAPADPRLPAAPAPGTTDERTPRSARDAARRPWAWTAPSPTLTQVRERGRPAGPAVPSAPRPEPGDTAGRPAPPVPTAEPAEPALSPLTVRRDPTGRASSSTARPPAATVSSRRTESRPAPPRPSSGASRHADPAWHTPPAAPPRRLGPGLAAVVVGVVGVLTALAPSSGLVPGSLPTTALGPLPVFGLVGAVLGVLALVLGAVAMIRSGRSAGTLLVGVVGSCAGAAAVVVGLVV